MPVARPVAHDERRASGTLQPTLLEREAPLTTLRSAFADALTGRGRLVLLVGEAGAGQTALVRAFCEEARPRAGILVGACDPLVTPRPLGPIVDVAAETGGELEQRASEESGASGVFCADGPASSPPDRARDGRPPLVLEPSNPTVSCD